MEALKPDGMYILTGSQLLYVHEKLDRIPCMAINEVDTIRDVLSRVIPANVPEKSVAEPEIFSNEHLD